MATWADVNSAILKLKSLLTYEKMNEGIASYGRKALYRAINIFHLGGNGFYTRNVKASDLASTPGVYALSHEDPTTGSPDANTRILGQAEGRYFDLGLPAANTGHTFENNATTVYQLGVRAYPTEIPDWEQDCIAANPRTGEFEYFIAKERAGNYIEGLTSLPSTDASKTVFVEGSNLIIVVDELWEYAGANKLSQDHSDIPSGVVRVFLKDPKTSVVASAILTATVNYAASVGATSWLGSRNYLSIALDGNSQVFKQNASDIRAQDVCVFQKGPIVFSSANEVVAGITKDISTDSEWVYIGAITGHATTPTFNGTGQNYLRPGTLDEAYDGPTGSGAGRDIVADSGSVRVTNNIDDTSAAIELIRDSGTDPDGTALLITQAGVGPGLIVSPTEANTVSARFADNTSNEIVWQMPFQDASTNWRIEDYNGVLRFGLVSDGSEGTLTISPNNMVSDGDFSQIAFGNSNEGLLVCKNVGGSVHRFMLMQGNYGVFHTNAYTNHAEVNISTEDYDDDMLNSQSVYLRLGGPNDVSLEASHAAGVTTFTGKIDGSAWISATQAAGTSLSTDLTLAAHHIILGSNDIVLEDNGDATISGDYKYASAKASEVSYWGDFKSNDSTDTLLHTDAGVYHPAASPAIVLYKDIAGGLPENCVLSSVSIYFTYDADNPPSDLTLYIKKLAGGVGTPTDLVVGGLDLTIAGGSGAAYSTSLTTGLGSTAFDAGAGDSLVARLDITNDAGTTGPTIIHSVTLNYTYTTSQS